MMMPRGRSAAIFLSAVLTGALAATAETLAAEDGAALYKENCASCHGENLEGEPDWRSPKPDGTLPAPPHDSSGHTWHHGDQLLFDYTKLGGAEALRQRGVTGVKSAMPPFAEVLSDDEIQSILAYIKSRWGARERAFQARVSAQE